jgi:hypothetical protein
MTIPSTWRNRLRVLEERRAAARLWRPVREITDDMSIAEIQDEWARTLEEANASTVEGSPAKVRDPAELDRLARAFAKSIGAKMMEF